MIEYCRLKMETRCNEYIILIVLLLFIPQIISGCTAPVSSDLYEKDVYREEVDLIGKDLFENKCSLCHELPDIDTYPYTAEDWSSVIDIMHDTKAARKFITIEEVEKIRVYLKRRSQIR